MKDNRQSIQHANPSLDHVEIMKIISTMWKELPGNVRRQYDERAQADKLRYQEDIQIFSDEYNRMMSQEDPSPKPRDFVKDFNANHLTTNESPATQ